MTAKLRIGFSGDRDGAVARALTTRVDLNDYHPAVAVGQHDVVLIDAGAKTRLDDNARLKDLITAGVSVGWVDPDAATLDAVAAVFGCRFEARPGLLMIADVLHDGHRRRRVETVGGAAPDEPGQIMAVSTAGDAKVVDAKFHPPAAVDLAELIADAAVRDWKRSLPATASLIPPNGAIYSATQYTHTLSLPLGARGPFGGPGIQTFTFSLSAMAYQYYANGNGENQYQVIVVSGFSLSPGTLVNDFNQLCNWVQTQVQPSLTLTATGANAVANTIHTPSSAASPQPVNETVSQQMSFQIQGQPHDWTAEYSNTYQIPDWAMVDQSDVGSGLTQWLFHETTTWDPTVLLPANFYPDWGNNFFDSDDLLPRFPTASTTTYNVEVVSGWSVSGNPGNAGPLNITLNPTLLSGMYGFANGNFSGWGGNGIMYWLVKGVPSLIGATWPVTVDLVATT